MNKIIKHDLITLDIDKVIGGKYGAKGMWLVFLNGPNGSLSIVKERKTKKEILASYRILKHAFDKVIDFHILEEILKRARNDKPLC